MTSILLSFTTICLGNYEPHGRYYPEDENMPLPDLGFAGTSLLIGVGLILVGWIVNQSTKKGKEESTNLGCLFAVGGFACCIPGLIWLQAIINSIIFIGIVLVAIVIILSLIWEKIKGNS